MAQLLPNGRQQFLDANGNPLVGGLVYFYIPNTTTPKDTWQDAAKSTLNTNPVVCDARGQATIYGEGDYRQILQDAAGNQIWDKSVLAPSVGPSTYVSDSDPSAQAQAYDYWLDTASGLRKQRNAANSAWTTLGPLLDLFFARSNVLGTVSQSGGVPTGALIESGSNANGNYTRFADGTQVCWRKVNTGSWGITTAYGNVYISSSTGSYTFPVAFSDVPAVSGATWDVDGGLPITSFTSATATGMSLRFTSGISATLSLGILWLAIGRWF